MTADRVFIKPGAYILYSTLDKSQNLSKVLKYPLRLKYSIFTAFTLSSHCISE